MLRVRVYGRPAPKGSRTNGVTRHGRRYTRPASKYEKPWAEAVAAAVSERETIQPPYSVTLEFAITEPGKPTWPWPSQADLDKLARCTIDGLVAGGAILDDRHVIHLGATKRWTDGDSFCDVRIFTP